MRRILVIGACSAIAESVSRIFAERGDALYLVARNAAGLASVAADLKVRGASAIGWQVMDAADLPAHAPMLDRCEQFLQGLDTVLIAYGTLSDQNACESSATLTALELHNNGVSVAALMMEIAARLERRGTGTLAVISSVAGERGRRSNYVYGSAKALVTAFASGMRQRLRKSGVSVVTIKPGPVDTPMTAQFRKGALWARPDSVARTIARAIDRSIPVVYAPWFWRPVMFVIRIIPEFLFQRLTL